MNLVDIMKEQEIDINWIFTHAKFHDKEGLFFFESIIKENEDGIEEHFFETKCILVDDAKFTYGDDMEKEISINTVDNKVVFNRVDGASVSIDTSELSDLPFKLIEFGITTNNTKPNNFVEID